MTRALATCVMLICAAACAQRAPDAFPTPGNVFVETGAISGSLKRLHAEFDPIVAPNNAPPQIKRIGFNTLNVCRLGHEGCRSDWYGDFVTSTNVASVEVRTNLFSINVPRIAFGRFEFRLGVLDLPPIFIRDYRLRVIARNSAGVAVEEDMPFHIR